MCAITGLLSVSPDNVEHLSDRFRNGFVRLLKASEERGRDGFGYLIVPTEHSGRPTIREQYIPRQGYKPEDLQAHYNHIYNQLYTTKCLIANHRAEPTTEYVENKRTEDQQPYRCGDWFAVHNGTIANDKQLMDELKVDPPTQIDSFAIPALAAVKGIHHLRTKLKGSYATLLWNTQQKELIALRNYQPLTVLYVPGEEVFVFSSLLTAKEFIPGSESLNFPPYSLGRSFKLHGAFSVETEDGQNGQRALVVCSGGLDSTTAATVAKRNHQEVCLLHFLYGCMAEEREMKAVADIAERLNCQYKYIDMGWLKQLGGSSLTENGKISDGVSGAEFAHEWVPARNTAMIGITAAYADRFDCGSIYLGLNLEEAGAYPDNTVEFYQKFNAVLDCGTRARPQIINPLGNLTKKEIVELAYKLGAPIDLSWSCYHGGAKHCGTCGPCHMRQVAHQMIGREDSVAYEYPLRK